MNIQIKLFAAARQATGRDQVSVTVSPPVTVADIRKSLVTQFPELRDLTSRSLVAVDTAYVADDTIVDEHADVALIPPVSGG